MVSQVQVVSILMIVHGAMVSLLGVLFALMGPFMFAMISMDRRGIHPNDQAPLTIITIVFGVGGLLVLACGILHIIAGVRALNFRGRTLALVALFSNALVLFTGYCSLFAIGMAIYGLIVMFDADVARAFQMAEEGVSPQDIRAEFAPARRRRRYSEDREDDRRRRPAAEDREGPEDGDRDRFR